MHTHVNVHAPVQLISTCLSALLDGDRYGGPSSCEMMLLAMLSARLAMSCLVYNISIA